ncbi:MAG: DUF308 domain-containing protein [Spirochaetaceae bacterium]|nr:DUF308 domain-containing protein [Spirochaetaceae bacterium]
MKVTIEDQEPIEQALWQSWKILLIRGIFISLVGLILAIWPSSGLAFTAIAFSLFILLDGVTQLVIGFRMSGSNRFWWGSVFRGVLEIIIAAVVISHPRGFGEFGASALLVILGIVLIISGIIDFQFRIGKGGIFSSLILLLLGILLLIAPLFTASIVLRIIGISALLVGVARIVRALQYKRAS